MSLKYVNTYVCLVGMVQYYNLILMTINNNSIFIQHILFFKLHLKKKKKTRNHPNIPLGFEKTMTFFGKINIKI